MRSSYQTKSKNIEMTGTDRTDGTLSRMVSSRVAENDERNASLSRSLSSDLERERVGSAEVRNEHHQPSTAAGVRSPSLDLGTKGPGTKLLDKGLERSAAQVVPCWILINLSHNSQPDGDVPNGTATTAMKVTGSGGERNEREGWVG